MLNKSLNNIIMGKKSKGLIGTKPKSMHEICSYQNNKKKKKLRDTIKMRSYEQIVSKVKVDKIEKTIKDLQAKDRAGRLEHDDYIKLMANRKVLKKKQEKSQGNSSNNPELDEYNFTPEELHAYNLYKSDPLLNDEFGKDLIPGYEPNSSLKPTGISAKAKNFVAQGSISKSAVIYSEEQPQKSVPKEVQVKKDEADPLISMKFENEIIHRKLPKDEPRREDQKPIVKPTNVVEVEELKEEVKKVGMKRPMFIPMSVRTTKRKKEEPVIQKVQEIPIIKEIKEEKHKPITSVPAPENLMLLDLSDESDEETEKRKDLQDLLNDFD